MKAYLDILAKILKDGKPKQPTRGSATVSNATIALPNVVFSHEMSDGFPLLTTKKMSLKNIAVELEGFINGITDKSWYQERGCHIWDNWCSPLEFNRAMIKAIDKLLVKDKTLSVKEAIEITDKNKLILQKEINALGPIYGAQWRNFNNMNNGDSDQLKTIVDKLHNTPYDRRMVCSAWNPNSLLEMALPPCHYSWAVTVIDDKINLMWTMRSNDFAIGAPYNIASYGLLLELLAKESGFKAGNLTGIMLDCHIYTNQIDGCIEQLKREPRELPKIEILTDSIFNWTHKDFKLTRYNPHPRISFGDITV